MFSIRNVNELIEVLKVYARENGHVPVRFTSNECGGSWPENKVKMECPIDECISLVGNPISDPTGKNAYLRISLFTEKKN